MIKKSKKKLIFALILSVFSASLFCCCLTGVSQANSTDINAENVKNHCHSDAPETANSTDSTDCECEQTPAILDTKGFDFLNSKLSLTKFTDSLFLQTVSFSNTVEKTIILTKHSPPIVYAQVLPLYLEFSVLRI